MVSLRKKASRTTSWLGVLLASVLAFIVGEAWGQSPGLRKPPPPGVIELVGLNIYSVLELKDGSLLANNGRVSRDGGKTWSVPRPLVSDASLGASGAVGTGLVRLQSGKIAFTAASKIWLSEDEGKSWAGPVEAVPNAIGGPYFLGAEMVQLSRGRLLYPFYLQLDGDHPEMKYENVLARGIWKGNPFATEGHHHFPEFYATIVAYSDDEGKTWTWPKKSGQATALMGWFDEEGKPTGYAGVLPTGEATVAETKDQGVMLMARSTVNRVVQSYSRDSGLTWSLVLPSELANSGSPARLRRIPKTGDLMVVWNQVSKEEIQRGYRRGRLSVAISKDNGATWENFKTLELSEGLDDIARILPLYPIKMTRARDWGGQLPGGFMVADYPNVCFVGDQVYISYFRGALDRGKVEEPNKFGQVLRIYPLEWFYK